jgi:methionyl-tRNA formyltransferase
MDKPSILFLGKRGDSTCDTAADFLVHSANTRVHTLTRDDSEKEKEFIQAYGKYDYIISFLCPWVLPEHMLNKAKIAAINFHPAPPEYPGLGCTNFAIYDQVTQYGVTCHHMKPEVDSGNIIDVVRFKVTPEDTVRSLTLKCYDAMLPQFYMIMGYILGERPFPEPYEKWTRKAYTRQEYDNLFKLHTSMSEDEINRTIKACTYPGYRGAYYEFYDKKFYHMEDE